MYCKKKGWTTVADLEKFNEITWSYLTNITMTWQYDGMSYLFRKAGIPIYGKDCGTLKMNHPIVCMAVPQSRDKNYGVDIYVPVEKKERAEKIIADMSHVRKYAELEVTEGKAAREEFDKTARELQNQRQVQKKERARARRNAFMALIKPRFSTDEN